MILTLRIVLALVFAVAGVAKLADRPGSRQALAGFGVPDWASGAAATLLPLAELAASGLLLFGATAGAWLTVALLATFIAAIARSMARGESPDCHCFGQLHSAPAGPRTLARNAVLAAAAIIVAFASDPGPSAFGWLRTLDGTQLALVATTVALLLLIAALARFTFALLQQNGRILQRLDELEGAQPSAVRPVAPSFVLPNLDGERISLEALRAEGRPALILFTSPDCAPCSALMPEIGEWQRAYASQLTIAVVSRGGAAANRAKAQEHGIERLLLQEDREVALAYDCPATPTAILVAADGTLASAPAPGADAIRQLVRRALQDAPAAATPRAAVTSLELPDLDGEPVALAASTGGKRALLFWNPSCGFCDRMLPELRAWEQAAGDDLELIVVSRGDPQINRDQGLRSTIVLDDDFAAGQAFSARGTPSAILLGEDGRPASPVVAGAPAVLELIGAAPIEANGRARLVRMPE